MKCLKCGKKLMKKWNYCPNCGFSINTNIVKNNKNFTPNLPAVIHKELNQLLNIKPNKPLISGLAIQIAGDGERFSMKVKPFGNHRKYNYKEKKKFTSKKILKNLLNKKTKIIEAHSKIRRLSNKIIYEIDVPGVENKDDIFVNKLEKNIEVRAFAKDKAYFKLIPYDFEILNYRIKDGKMFLELNPE